MATDDGMTPQERQRAADRFRRIEGVADGLSAEMLARHIAALAVEAPAADDD